MTSKHPVLCPTGALSSDFYSSEGSGEGSKHQNASKVIYVSLSVIEELGLLPWVKSILGPNPPVIVPVWEGSRVHLRLKGEL